jgi:hypothetical protein
MTKLCSVCKTIKTFDCFYKASKSKDGYVNRCKDCDLAYQRSRKSEKKISSARWYAVNKGTYLLNARIQAKEKRVKKYSVIFASSSEYGVEKWRKYRAKRVLAKVQATPSWVDLPHHSKINEIYAITQQLQEATGSIYHVDHIVPLVSDVVCGLHVWWNLQPMPEKANMLKNNLFEPSLYPEQGEVAFPLRNGPITTRNVVSV